MRSRFTRAPIIVALSAMVIGLAPAPPVGAQETLDQYCLETNGTSFDCGNPPARGSLWQGFVPSRPVLSSVAILLRLGGGIGDGALSRIRVRSGTLDGPVLAEATQWLDLGPGSSDWFVHTLPRPICVTPGETYFIEWVSMGGLLASWLGNPNNAYTPGAAYFCGRTTYQSWDLCFQTFSVPIRDVEPPTLTVAASPDTLWPPDGRLVPVQISLESRDDGCGPVDVRLVSVTFSPAPGPEDDRRPSIVDADIGTRDTLVRLRASPGRHGEPRVYTLVYEAVDGSGARTVDSTHVVVPRAPTASNAAGDLRVLRIGPVPVPRCQALSVRLLVGDGQRAVMECVDVAGRVVVRRELDGLSPGEHDVQMPLGGTRPGAYWARLRQDGVVVSNRFLVVE